jgi:hypothetical protein
MWWLREFCNSKEKGTCTKVILVSQQCCPQECTFYDIIDSIMASWASKRKIWYLLGVSVILFSIAMIPVFMYVNRVPTCSDNVHNQDEEDVDCGGPCAKLCHMGNDGLIVDWARVFHVEDGMYDMGALVENTNTTEGATEAIYHFKMYDENNILIAERFGKTFVLPNSKWVIFEGNVSTGERIPRHAFIDFPETIDWIRTDLLFVDIPNVAVRDTLYREQDGVPRVTATLSNKSPFAVENVEVIAVLSDSEGTAVGLSKTVISRLEKYDSIILTFTWREPFPITPVKIDIIPRVDYMDAYVVQ